MAAENKRYDIDPDDILPIAANHPELLKIAEAGRREKERHERVQAKLRRRRARDDQRLTQRIAERALPRDKEYTIKTDIPCLGLRIRPSGHKEYIYCGKRPNGKGVKRSLGEQQYTTLDEARAKALEFRRQIGNGEDPFEKKIQEKTRTFDELFQEYLMTHVKPQLSVRWGDEIERIYSKHIVDVLGNSILTKITRFELMECAKAGSTENVRLKIFNVLSGYYSWTTNAAYTDRNILSGTRLFKAPKPRKCVLDDRKLKAVWLATFQLPEPWGRFGRLLILSGQRRGEVADAHWREIDLKAREWVIPDIRMKNRHPHTVALTNTMMEQLGAIPESKQNYIFESNKIGGVPISGFSQIVIQWKKLAGFDDWRLHDLRRTAATNMARLSVAPHVIEAVLAHRSGQISGIAAVYNRHPYADEKRKALEQWNGLLAEIISKEYPNPEEVVL